MTVFLYKYESESVQKLKEILLEEITSKEDIILCMNVLMF